MQTSCAYLNACVRRTRIDDHLMDLAILAKVLVLLENLRFRQSGRQTDDKNEILLHHSHVGQMLTVLGDLLLALLIALSFLRL